MQAGTHVGMGMRVRLSANDTRRQNCEALTAEYKVLMMMMSNGQWRERVSPRCTRCSGVDGESEDQFCAA